MKKLVLLAAFAVIATCAQAQTNKSQNYAEIVGQIKTEQFQQKGTDGYMIPGTTYAVNIVGEFDEQTKKDIEKTSNLIEAMNYLSKKGWIFVQCYTEGKYNNPHWIIKK